MLLLRYKLSYEGFMLLKICKALEVIIGATYPVIGIFAMFFLVKHFLMFA